MTIQEIGRIIIDYEEDDGFEPLPEEIQEPESETEEQNETK